MAGQSGRDDTINVIKCFTVESDGHTGRKGKSSGGKRQEQEKFHQEGAI